MASDMLRRRLAQAESASLVQAQAEQHRQIMQEQQHRWTHNFVMETARDLFVSDFNWDRDDGIHRDEARIALGKAKLMAEEFGIIIKQAAHAKGGGDDHED